MTSAEPLEELDAWTLAPATTQTAHTGDRPELGPAPVVTSTTRSLGCPLPSLWDHFGLTFPTCAAAITTSSPARGVGGSTWSALGWGAGAAVAVGASRLGHPQPVPPGRRRRRVWGRRRQGSACRVAPCQPGARGAGGAGGFAHAAAPVRAGGRRARRPGPAAVRVPGWAGSAARAQGSAARSSIEKGPALGRRAATAPLPPTTTLVGPVVARSIHDARLAALGDHCAASAGSVPRRPPVVPGESARTTTPAAVQAPGSDRPDRYPPWPATTGCRHTDPRPPSPPP